MLLGLLMDSERVLFAAIRASGGDLTALEQAIELGKADWRDLLMSGGFGYDVNAHEHWVPRTVTPEIAETWRSGGQVDDVHFSRGLAVLICRGDFDGAVASVRSLDALEPEARYTLALRDGTEISKMQSFLEPAD